MPASSILLLDTDLVSGRAIESVLTAAGYSVRIVSEAEGVPAAAAEHQLVIIDVVAPPTSAIDVCRSVRAAQELAGIPILCVSQTDDVDERIRFLEAGADDVMARPFDDRELEARVEALLLRFQRSTTMTPVISADGVTVARARRSVAVYSPKGGVGTTTIATNIAVAAAAKRPDRVALLDLSLQFGGVASHLNLEPKLTLADVVRDESSMREAEIIKPYLARHESGVHVLASPATPERAELITAHHVELVLRTLLDAYDAVVVDAGSILDERTMTVLDSVERVVLPVYPDIAALRAVHTLLDYLNEVGSIPSKTTYVLNNTFPRELLKLRDIEAALGTRIAQDMPYDAFLYLKAVNEGIPVVIGAPKTPVAETLVKLSASAFGEDGYVIPEEAPRKSGRFFRRGGSSS